MESATIRTAICSTTKSTCEAGTTKESCITYSSSTGGINMEDGSKDGSRDERDVKTYILNGNNCDGDEGILNAPARGG